jgi:hypothetical protein
VQDLTYTQLLTLIPQYAERFDEAFAAQIPNFIMFAENRIATDMKQQGFQAVVSGTLPLTSSMAKPSFWKETISFTFTSASGASTPLFLRPLEYLRNYWPNETLTGTPRFYADYNATHFLFAPTPSAALQFELVYYARLQPLTSTNDSNWMTLNVPQALMAACMVEACRFTKNAARQAIWEDAYAAANNAIKSENAERQADRTTVFTRP